jgi:hypothetical protein
MKIRANLYFERGVWEHYKKVCREYGLVPSRRIETFMKRDISRMVNKNFKVV